MFELWWAKVHVHACVQLRECMSLWAMPACDTCTRTTCTCACICDTDSWQVVSTNYLRKPTGSRQRSGCSRTSFQHSLHCRVWHMCSYSCYAELPATSWPVQLYSGHVINLLQEVISFSSNLPWLPSKLDVMFVRKEGANQSHRDFRVRRSAVQWVLSCGSCWARAFWLMCIRLARHCKVASVAEDSLTLSEQQVPSTEEGQLYNAHLVQSFRIIFPLYFCDDESLKWRSIYAL